MNLGSGREISIGDLARLIAEIADVQLEILCDEERLRPVGSEVERLLADTSLVRELTGWAPAVPLREGLKRTLAWFRDADRSRYRDDRYTV